MANSRFVYVTYIRTTPEKLWQVLTDPEITRRFWHECRQESEWKIGASWRLMIPDGRVGDSGDILEIDPPRRLGRVVAQRIRARTARGRVFAHDL